MISVNNINFDNLTLFIATISFGIVLYNYLGPFVLSLLILILIILWRMAKTYNNHIDSKFIDVLDDSDEENESNDSGIESGTESSVEEEKSDLLGKHNIDEILIDENVEPIDDGNFIYFVNSTGEYIIKKDKQTGKLTKVDILNIKKEPTTIDVSLYN